ncbi:hypothetical protein FGO68_gene1219 [Halteria grandinella]|uniref:Uncharacterized protein n=1 Tax=Halteria grandinella TaxID=5974 RepID=A0A8J8NL17_HALGN|nr:hypothetical protein FGO68_gene1219 [Halteria grandinella]
MQVRNLQLNASEQYLSQLNMQDALQGNNSESQDGFSDNLDFNRIFMMGFAAGLICGLILAMITSIIKSKYKKKTQIQSTGQQEQSQRTTPMSSEKNGYLTQGNVILTQVELVKGFAPASQFKESNLKSAKENVTIAEQQLQSKVIKQDNKIIDEEHLNMQVEDIENSPTYRQIYHDDRFNPSTPTQCLMPIAKIETFVASTPRQNQHNEKSRFRPKPDTQHSQRGLSKQSQNQLVTPSDTRQPSKNKNCSALSQKSKHQTRPSDQMQPQQVQRNQSSMRNLYCPKMFFNENASQATENNQ